MAPLARVEKTVDVDVPRRTAFEHWTRLRDLPRFLQSVEEVTPLDDRHVRWKARILGRPVEGGAEITERIPNRRIEWRATGAPASSGVISFDPLSDLETRVSVRVEYEPQGFTKGADDVLGTVARRVEEDLRRFKHYVEGHVEGHGGRAGAGDVPP